MTVNQLKKEYNELKSLEDSDDGIFDFKESLLSSDGRSILEFHLEILKDREDPYLNRDIFAFFSDRKNKEKVGNFIYNKLQLYLEDKKLLADLIQILGHLRSDHTIEVVEKFIGDVNKDVRYRCIIALGWVGTENDLPLLQRKLMNDIDGELRGFSATAMRQIYFNNVDVKNTILNNLALAIEKESNAMALQGIIVTAQDLMKKKLGLNESQYGDVEGDIDLARIKTISALEKYGNN